MKRIITLLMLTFFMMVPGTVSAWTLPNASPNPVPYGGNTTVSWSLSQIMGSSATCSVKYTGVNYGANDSVSVGPIWEYADREVTCCNVDNPANPICQTWAVDIYPTPVVNCSLSPTSIASGGSATFSFSSSGATNCSATSGATSNFCPGPTNVVSGSFTCNNITASDNPWTVTCTNPGASASCNASLMVAPSQTGTWSYPSDCPTACGQPETTQTQVCTGGNGLCSGSAASRTCSATAACGTPVDGVCGSSNGSTFASAPSTNLCSAGSATSVTGTGPWYWNCSGSNGGSSASCSATPAAAAGTNGCTYLTDIFGNVVTATSSNGVRAVQGRYKNTNPTTMSGTGGPYCYSTAGTGAAGSPIYFVPQKTAAEFNSFWCRIVACSSNTPVDARVGLIGWWKFDEASGTSGADSSGYSRTATLTSNFARPAGLMGNAITISGGGYVSLGGANIPLNNDTGAMSISLWFKPTQAGVLVTVQNVAYGSTPTKWDPLLYIQSTGKVHGGGYKSGYPALESASSVLNGAWHHAVYTNSGGASQTQTLYVDGVLSGSVTGAMGGITGGNAYWYVGNGYWYQWPNTFGISYGGFSGQIDDLRIYNKALTSTEVAAIRSYGLAPVAAPASPLPGVNAIF